MMNPRRRAFLFLSACAMLIADAAAQDWTRFRGPNGTGVSESKSIPVTWTEKDFRGLLHRPGVVTADSPPGELDRIAPGRRRSAASGEVALAAEDAWKIFTRGIRGDEAENCAKISGNHELASKVLHMVSVIA